MISRDVIQWLVKYMKTELVRDEHNLKNGVNHNMAFNPYLLEYGWALLMNLCLHEESQEPSFIMGADILTCVVKMLVNHPSKDVCYLCIVNCRKEIRKIAHLELKILHF